MKFRGFPKIKNDLHGVFSTSLYIALFVVDVPIMFLWFPIFSNGFPIYKAPVGRDLQPWG